MAYKVSLPKKASDLEKVAETLVRRGTEQRNIQAVKWWIVHWYMRGARNFTELNYQDGTVQVSYMDESGTLQFQYEDILSKYQSQLGRLIGIDLAPTVSKLGISLDGLRKSSIAQVVLDEAFPTEKVRQLERRIWPMLLQYGTVGLVLWVEDAETFDIEVVPPWELIPIPVDIADASSRRGIIRTRRVPLDSVKTLSGAPSPGSKIYNEMKKTDIPIGLMPNPADDKFAGTFSSPPVDGTFKTSTAYPSGSKQKDDKTDTKTVELWEVWTETTDGYLAEYAVFAGGKLVSRYDHSRSKIHMPIYTATDIEVGGFYGRSFVDMLIPMNTEMEYTIGKIFQNIQDYDLYGIIVEPTTTGMPAEIFRGADGLKRARYEPDYTAPEHKPYNMAPIKPGNLFTEVLKVGMTLSDKLANQPTDLMSGDAPGRVDSSAGLGFLYEVSSIPLSPSAKSVAGATSGCYRAMLGLIRNMWDATRTVSISMLDDALAGVVLDPNTGAVQLANNAIPHPDEVRLTVGSEMPKSVQQQKAELKEALQMQAITMTEYRIKARKQGLDLPVGNEAEWQNYRRAMLENLVLFGNGKEPGPVIVSDTDMHQVHLMVLDGFMARPEFYLAEPTVRNKFVEHRHAHLAGLGQLPEGMPYPEQAAEEEDGMMKQLEQMMGQEGGGMNPEQMDMPMEPMM